MPESSAKEYDLIAIGGGPAGMVGASTATDLGKTVALIHRHRELGGAGINTGTVPSKTLRETAIALSGLKAKQIYGVDLSLRREATVSDFLGHERHLKASYSALLAQQLTRRSADTFFGEASFVDAHTVKVVGFDGAETFFRGKNILIGTGSAPARPAGFPWGTPGIYDSDDILELKSIPKTMAVIGAGVIGSEYACTFNALGATVHLIDGRDSLLPFLDHEVSRALTASMERNGVKFIWNQRVESCVCCGDGAKGEAPLGITLKLTSGEELTVDAVLIAAGRTSNTSALNLAAAGVPVGDRGLIKVDRDYRTAVPHIFAAGDVIGFPALASTSMDQARRAVHAALGVPVSDTLPMLLPNGIYTIPEASMIGETEASLTKAGVEYLVGRAFYRDNARARIIGDGDGFLKLLLRKSDMKVLGVHVMGEHATEVVHVGLMAMLVGANVQIFQHACFNVPTLGGLYKLAATDVLGKVSGTDQPEVGLS